MFPAAVLAGAISTGFWIFIALVVLAVIGVIALIRGRV
jgi:hypothetical protein